MDWEAVIDKVYFLPSERSQFSRAPLCIEILKLEAQVSSKPNLQNTA